MWWWYNNNLELGRANVRKSESRRRASGKAAATHLSWRERNREHLREYKRAKYADGTDARESYLAYLKAYRQEHNDVITAQKAQWAKANPDKVRASSHRRLAARANSVGSFTDAEWQALVRKQRGRCANCGGKRKLTADHIVPLSRGGSSYICNIQGLCKRCNSAKHNTLRPGTQHTLFDGVTPDPKKRICRKCGRDRDKFTKAPTPGLKAACINCYTIWRKMRRGK